MTQHTPGPWRAHPRSGNDELYDVCAIRDAGNTPIPLIWIASLPNTSTVLSEEREANARLIAAAPTLFHDLQTALEWLDNLEFAIGHQALCDSMPNNRPGRGHMRATIAQATGGS